MPEHKCIDCNQVFTGDPFNCGMYGCKHPNRATNRDPLLVERERTHGSFAKNAEIWWKLTSAAHHTGLNQPQQLAMAMINVKLSRILSGQASTKDHWLDIAGYAKLGAEACD